MIMGESRRKRKSQYRCFCFDTKALQARARTGGDITMEVPRSSHRRLSRSRFLDKFFNFPALSPSPNHIVNVRKRSGASLASKELDLGIEDEWKSASIFSSSSDCSASVSSSSSSSSSPSSRSLAAPAAIQEELEVPKPRQNYAPSLPAARASEAGNPALMPARIRPSATAMLMLVESLLITVFCGRKWAIFWTALWLYIMACLYHLRRQRRRY